MHKVSTVTATRDTSLQGLELEDPPKHDHGAAIVVVEIDALGHFSSSDREQDRTAAVITGLRTKMRHL